MSVEFESVSLEWAKKCNVSRKCINDGYSSFVGNDCYKLLNSIDILESMKCLGICKYVEVFRKLAIVVHGCFSLNLDSKFKDYIKSFKASYMALGISITPKIHIIFEHVSEFCEHSKQGK